MVKSAIDFRLRTLPPQDVDSLRTQISSLYGDAFRLPPYAKSNPEIAEFERSILTHTQRTGFRMFGAFTEHDDEMIGFAYGYASEAGRWWYEQVYRALSPTVAHTWLPGSFQMVEIAVRPAFQGKGIGGKLHDALITGSGYPRAVLTTLDAITSAHVLYEHRGWTTLAQQVQFPEVPRVYKVLGLRLTEARG